MEKIAKETLDKAISYETFRALNAKMVLEGFTSGPNQSPIMLQYTEINDFRMKRLDRTTVLNEEIQSLLSTIQSPLIFLSITEAWCGDGAQILPVIDKIASSSQHIEHNVIFRDEHPEVIDAFLTNGARSIPIVIVLDATTFEVLGHWGPRPETAQAMVMDAKLAAENADSEELKKKIKLDSQSALQSWYARDKTKSIQLEFGAFLAVSCLPLAVGEKLQ
ncbi:MAG: thioredoxin family protein [Saprospiraceae bacterium]